MGVGKVSNKFTAFSLDSYCEILLLILVIMEKIFYVIVLCRHLKPVIYLAAVRQLTTAGTHHGVIKPPRPPLKRGSEAVPLFQT